MHFVVHPNVPRHSLCRLLHLRPETLSVSLFLIAFNSMSAHINFFHREKIVRVRES